MKKLLLIACCIVATSEKIICMDQINQQANMNRAVMRLSIAATAAGCCLGVLTASCIGVQSTNPACCGVASTSVCVCSICVIKAQKNYERVRDNQLELMR